jgi:hypothetical protein
MNISDHILSIKFANIFWVGGGPCGGKTTIVDAVAQKYGFKAFHADDLFFEHQKLACLQDHPAMLRPFLGWEWFFSRSPDEFARFIHDSSSEQFQMVVLDLLGLASQNTVIVDGFLLDPDYLKRIAPYNKSIYLFANEEIIRSSYFARDDKKNMLSVINTLKDPEKAKNNYLDAAVLGFVNMRERVKKAGMKYIVRDNIVTDVLKSVELHFGLAK